MRDFFVYAARKFAHFFAPFSRLKKRPVAFYYFALLGQVGRGLHIHFV